MKSVIAVVSGGIDSTTLLWYLHHHDYQITETITFNYGQRHVKELESSIEVVKAFKKEFNVDLPHQVIDIGSIGKLLNSGALTGDEAVPHEMYDQKSQRVTIVPNRNMIFLSIAAGRAVALGARYVAYAAHASDYSVYPDCRPEFIEQMDKALYLGNLWTPINILAPFKDLTKVEVVQVGLKLSVPYEKTWSCYEGKENPCLRCGTCLERTEAFLKNESIDPSLDEKEWADATKFLRVYAENS